MTLSNFKASFCIPLTPQQEAAVQAIRGPVLLLAVPGSGKTTVLVTRIGYMIYGYGIQPENILTMTYTVSAARDMRARFSRLFGETMANRLAFHTIHGVCSRIIREYAHRYGRTAFGLLEDSRQQTGLLAGLYQAQTGEIATESSLKNILNAITYVKNSMIRPEDFRALTEESLDFPALFRAYCRGLREQHFMDYDDQLIYAHQILLKAPDILEMFQNKFTYICVDEAQDTSKIQHTIIQLLAGKQGNLFMVGDEDQSIYGFRAAYPQALTEFEHRFPGATVLYLEENYRSTPQIIEAANAFIQQNANRHPKQMQAIRAPGLPIQTVSVYDRRAQYQYLCRLAKTCSLETAILYRDNDSALPLIDLFQREGVSYRCRQMDSGFFTHRIVRDITDIIHFARTPHDGEIFLRIYYKLRAGITRDAAQKAAEYCTPYRQNIFLYLSEAPGLSPWSRKQCKALNTHLVNLLTESGDRAIYRIVHFMGYGAYLEERKMDQNKTQILEALGALEPTPEALLERLQILCQLVRAGSPAQDSNLVLSTIHSSKGLEFDRVVLMDVADGIFPKFDAYTALLEEQSAYEEERRLFYVGMTRAKNKLTVLRFRSPELPSAFAEFLFLFKETHPLVPIPEGAQAKPKRKSISPPGKVNTGSEDASILSTGYLPGIRLHHGHFGPGTLTTRNEDVITVQFDDGTTKRLSISAALRANQLRLLP
jgi:DNA helicase-2/ATP-dependent DNA helicase PcrA